MYTIKISFLLIIIPSVVFAQEFWYPATMTEESILSFPVTNKFYTHNITRDFEVNSTTTNKDHDMHTYNWDITEHKKRVKLFNQTAVSKKIILKGSHENMPFESERNQINKNMGFMRRDFNHSRSNRNDFDSLYFTSGLQKWEPLAKTIKNKIPMHRLSQPKTSNNDTVKSRFLDVFQVVEFEHVLCSSTSGLEGRCLHHYECQTIGGSPMGTCADGYGICCVIVFSCHGDTSEPVGWFTNPEYPLRNTDRLSCSLTLNKTSKDVKQIRLDFANFENFVPNTKTHLQIAQLLPPIGGTCENDQFVVSGQNINSVIPILCGINSGQHVYIEVGDTEGPIRLTIQTVAAESRMFSIKVTQLARSDILAAPTGCLQYYNGPHGYIESFNYRNNSEVTTVKRPSYLNNLNYAICIKREISSCSITYTNEDEMQIVNYDTDGLPIIPPRQAGVEIFNCPSDWLLISAVRLCGERLNDGSVLQDFYLDAPVTDTGAGPITIWFRSDEGYVGRGFKLQYQQNLCTITT